MSSFVIQHSTNIVLCLLVLQFMLSGMDLPKFSGAQALHCLPPSLRSCTSATILVVPRLRGAADSQSSDSPAMRYQNILFVYLRGLHLGGMTSVHGS